MIRLLTIQDAEQYKILRLLGLQTDPKAFLSTYEREKDWTTLYFAQKIRYATDPSRLGRSEAEPPIFGIYGFFKALKEPQSAKASCSQNGRIGSLRETEMRRRIESSLIGMVQLASEYHPKNKHLANIYTLYVHPDHRSQGIATKLVKHALSQVKSIKSIEQIHLRANSSNTAAIALYKRLGFTHIATRKNVVKEKNGTYQHELFFCLNL